MSSERAPRSTPSSASPVWRRLLTGAALIALFAWLAVRAIRPHDGVANVLFWPLLAAEAFAVVRFCLLVSLARTMPTQAAPDPNDVLAARGSGADVSVAIIVTGESPLAVRTSVLASIAAVDRARLMLIGPEADVRPIGDEFDVRVVSSDGSWDHGVVLAMSHSSATHVALTSASSAIVAAALDQVDIDARCGWVQTRIVAPESRSLLQHLQQLRIDPTIDRWHAAAWTGEGSIVRVEAFSSVDLSDGPLAITIELQQRGWYGRVGPLPLVIAQTDQSLVEAQRETVRVASSRLRVLRTRRSPLWTSGITLRQRVAHVSSLIDDLAGAVTLVVLAAIAVSIGVGVIPMQLGPNLLALGLVAHLIVALARYRLSGGLLRPGSLANQNADRIGESSSAVLRSMFGNRASEQRTPRDVHVGRRALVHRSAATTVAVALEIALVARAVSTVFDRGLPDRTKGIDLVLLAMGVVAVVPVLISLRIIVRNRQLRVGRRTQASVPVELDGVTARLVDLGSRGIGIESPAALTVGSETTATIFPPRAARDGLPIQVRMAVVRCRPIDAGYIIGLRVVEPAPSAAFDSFVALWAGIAASASTRPENVPSLQRERGASWLPAHGGGNRFARLATAATMVFVGAANMPPYGVGSAAPLPVADTFTLSATAPPTVLYGTTAGYTLTSCNTKATPRYNVAFRDVLPKGATYVAGSGSPAPTKVLTDVATGTSTLLWENISDLQVNSCFSISYAVAHNTTGTDGETLHVGDTIVNAASVHANTDPRYVPKFNATTGVVLAATGGSQDTASASASSKIVPVVIDKTEPSPEDELVRGVHNHTTPYTLTIRNNTIKATTATVVDDWLPAGLEFLGCGTADNAPTGYVEYNGAPRLDASTPDVPNCLAPTLVETVDADPDGNGSLPRGVYTHVRWLTGDLAAGATATVTYRAGIPNRKNVLFEQATGQQTANLTNNTGDVTTEPKDETVYTNLASVAGNYTGVVTAGTAREQTWSSDTETVSSEDLAIQKTACNATYRNPQSPAGDGCRNGVTYDGLTVWTLRIETSEYRSSSRIVVTDTVGDGLVYVAGSAVASNGTVTTPASGFEPSTSFSSDGTQRLVWSFDDVLAATSAGGAVGPGALAAQLGVDAVYTITFSTRTLSDYRKTGQPVLSFDTLNNAVGVTGNSAVVRGDDELATVAIADVSAASLTSAWGSITKKTLSGAPALAAPSSSSLGCSPGVVPVAPDVTPRFTRNEVVCFELRVVFPTGIRVRDAVLTDFLPPNTTYVGSATYPDHRSGFERLSARTTGTEPVRWTFGEDPNGSPRYTSPKGDVFHVVVAVRVGDDPIAGNNYDIVDNLFKVTTSATDGSSTSLRALDSYRIVEPELALYKGVVNILRSGTSIANYPKPAPSTVTADAHTARQRDVVKFALVVPNVAPQFADVIDPAVARVDALGRQVGDATAVTVWDVLPTGLTCADLATPIGTNLVATLQLRANALPLARVPSPTLTAVQCSGSRLSFVAASIPAGYQLAVEYSVVVSSIAAAGVSYTNTAGVRDYNDIGHGKAVYLPTSNIDPAVTTALANSPLAKDSAKVSLPSATIVKSVATAINEPGNSATTQATIGERATYSVTVTVPAGTAIYDATVSDELPAGLDYIENSIKVIASPLTTALAGGAFGSSDEPTGFTLADTANGWKLSLPATIEGHRNDTTADQKFTLVYDVVVLDVASNVHGTALANRAALSWSVAQGGAKVATPTSAKTITVVEPLADITKSHSPAGPFTGNDVVTYTVTALNTAGRSPLHDVRVTDCVPVGLGSITPAPVAAPSVVTVGAAGSCSAGGTLVTWVLAALETTAPPGLQPAAGAALTYTATVVNPAVADQPLVNTAEVTGTSIKGAAVGERTTYFDFVKDTLAIDKPTFAKSVTPLQLTNGQVATYTLVTALPAGLIAYDVTIADVLPANLVFDEYGSITSAYGSGCVLSGAAGHTIARDGRTIGWFLGDVSTGAEACVVTLTYSGHVAKAAISGDKLDNVAKLSWNVADKSSDISTLNAQFDRSLLANASIGVTEPKLTITKIVDDVDRLVDGGQLVGYTITITNVGSSAAYDIDLVDTLPAGLLTPAGSFGGDCIAAGTPTYLAPAITWALFPAAAGLAPGATCVLTYQQRVDAAVNLVDGQPMPNTASIRSFSGDADRTGPGAADFKTYTGPSATEKVTGHTPTLSIVKTTTGTADTGQAVLGQPFTWTVTVTNTSPLTPKGVRVAAGIDVVDTLPVNWTFDKVTSISGAASCAAAAVAPTTSIDGGAQTLTWTNLCNLQPGESAVIVYTAVAQPSAATTPGLVDVAGAHIEHVNSAVLSAEDAGGNPLPTRTDTATATIKSVDLVIVKTDASADDDSSPTSAGFTIGQAGFYYLDVSNVGPDTASGPITVTDTLPAGLTLTAAPTGPGWTCSAAIPFTCTHPGPLAPGKKLPQVTVGMDVSILALNNDDNDSDPTSGIVTNSATVTGLDTDRDLGNNTDSESTPVKRMPNFAIDKLLAPSTAFVPGTPVTYVLTVTNVGPSPATGPVTVTDPLPDGLRLVGAGGDGWDCTASVVGSGFAGGPTDDNGSASCSRTVTELGIGQLPPIMVTVDVDPAVTADAQIVNVARVTHSDDVDPSNDTNDEAANPAPVAKLTIAKDDGGATFAVGQADATYTIVVSNQGPSFEQGPVVVTDTAPPGLRMIAAAGPGWSCGVIAGTDFTTATGSFSCTWTGVGSGNVPPPPADGTVGPGKILSTITVTVEVGPNAITDPAPGAENLVVNTAGVVGVTDPQRHESSQATPVAPTAVLAVAKSHDSAAAPWRVGGNGSFDIIVTNSGPNGEYGPVTVTDPLPAGVTFVSASGAGWQCDVLDGPADGPNGTVACIAARPPGLDAAAVLLPADDALATIVVEVSVGPEAADRQLPDTNTIVNTATVVGTTDLQPHDGVDRVPVLPIVDLQISKTHQGTTFQVGGRGVFDLEITNNGPNVASAPIVVSDQLPAGLTFVESSGSGWSCTAAGQDVSCRSDSALPVGAITSLSLTVEVGAGAFDGSPLTNTATVTGRDEDPVPANNVDDDLVVVEPSIDLAIDKTHTGEFRVGGSGTFQLVVTNNGPNAHGTETITVVDTLPAGLTFESAAGEGWSCAAVLATTGDVVTCTRPGPLASGAAAPPISVTVRIGTAAEQGVINTATVASPERDVVQSNNRDTDAVTASAVSDLRIEKSLISPLLLGGQGTWRIVVVNDGPSAAVDVVIVDDMPVGMTVLQATSAESSCAVAGPSVSCTVASLANGAAVTVDIVVKVDAIPADGRSVNTATVASSSADPDPSDNVASAGGTAMTNVELASAAGQLSPPPTSGQSLPITGAAILGIVGAATAFALAGLLLLGARRRPSARRG